MSKLRDCPVCGRAFRKGRKCLVPTSDGRLVRKLVCLACAQSAERIVIKAEPNRCMMPICDKPGQVCSRHVAEAILNERNTALSSVRDDLTGQIAALKMTVRKDDTPHEWLDGKIEGMEAALGLLMKGPKG